MAALRLEGDPLSHHLALSRVVKKDPIRRMIGIVVADSSHNFSLSLFVEQSSLHPLWSEETSYLTYRNPIFSLSQ